MTVVARLSLSWPLAVLLSLAPQVQVAHSADIDDKRLQSASSNRSDWLSYGRDYSQQRFSPLDQINTKTVQSLVPKWIYQTGAAATFSTTPLVADGVMYLTAPFSHVIAVDAKTGREIWRYEHMRGPGKICCGPANRGAALGYGKVYVATVDARLVALDSKTGKPVWNIALAE